MMKWIRFVKNYLSGDNLESFTFRKIPSDIDQVC
jgi:hypothetical protein